MESPALEVALGALLWVTQELLTGHSLDPMLCQVFPTPLILGLLRFLGSALPRLRCSCFHSSLPALNPGPLGVSHQPLRQGKSLCLISPEPPVPLSPTTTTPCALPTDPQVARAAGERGAASRNPGEQRGGRPCLHLPGGADQCEHHSHLEEILVPRATVPPPCCDLVQY